MAEAVMGIVEAVPIYQDAIQPGAKQIGKAFETVGKAVNVALAPIAALVWAYDRIGEWLVNRLAEKLQNVPAERIRTPDLMIAGPTLEALRFAASDESLRDLYANLLATSIDSGNRQKCAPFLREHRTRYVARRSEGHALICHEAYFSSRRSSRDTTPARLPPDLRQKFLADSATATNLKLMC